MLGEILVQRVSESQRKRAVVGRQLQRLGLIRIDQKSDGKSASPGAISTHQHVTPPTSNNP